MHRMARVYDSSLCVVCIIIKLTVSTHTTASDVILKHSCTAGLVSIKGAQELQQPFNLKCKGSIIMNDT